MSIQTQELIQAVDAEDWEKAQHCLDLLGDKISAEAYEAASLTHLHYDRYREAYRLMSRIIQQTDRHMLTRRYIKNLIAFEERYGALAHQINASPASQHVGVYLHESGMYLASCFTEEGQAHLSYRNANPEEVCLKKAMLFHEQSQSFKPIGFSGFNEFLIAIKYQSLTKAMSFGMIQAIWMIEEDFALIKAVMTAYDLSGSKGLIKSSNVLWLIGPDWKRQASALLDQFPTLKLPSFVISAPQADRGIYEELEAFHEERRAIIKDASLRWKESSHRISTEDRIKKLQFPKQYRPKVAIPTTRFSSVLQYSSRDLVKAFEELGWEVHLLIEPDVHHRMSHESNISMMANIEPDLIVQIDHLRYQSKDMCPADIPYLCWIQDNLVNLTNSEVGKNLIKKRDYVVGPWSWEYILDYDYPERQVAPMPRLTSMSPPSVRRNTGKDDIIYISNHSQTIESKLEQTTKYLRDNHSNAIPVFTHAVKLLQESYENGQAHDAMNTISTFIHQAMSELEEPLDSRISMRTLEYWLQERINNILYRHQGIDMVIQAAEKLGATIGIYGAGWDKHSNYSKYARGYVEYGDNLTSLMNETPVSLILEPYFLLSHQRYLDCAAAGGFQLVRHRPVDDLIQQWIQWNIQHLPSEVTHYEQLLESVEDEAIKERIIQLNELIYPESSHDQRRDKAIQMFQQWRKHDYIKFMYLPPRYSEFNFNSQQQLEERLNFFLHHEDQRTALANAQRDHVEKNFKYGPNLNRVTQWIAELMSEEAQERMQ